MSNKVYLTWADVAIRACAVARQIKNDFTGKHAVRLYGIPRGGYHAVQAVARQYDMAFGQSRIVMSPEEADFFIDDIIDSGKTRDKWARWKQCDLKGILALVDYQGKDKDAKGQWVVFPWEIGGEDAGPTENIVRLLQNIGEDPEREGLKETPARVIKSFAHLYGGYNADLKSIMKTFVDDKVDEMVILKDIEFYSTCEHHMLPFSGKAHIAYIPDGKIIGISKLARVLEVFARRLQIQERLCQQVTETLNKYLEPLGAACIMEAQHLCMTARGVEKQHSKMVTSSLTGVFKDKPEARQELLQMVNNG